jgi:hypothetical protein
VDVAQHEISTFVFFFIKVFKKLRGEEVKTERGGGDMARGVGGVLVGRTKLWESNRSLPQ